MKQHSCDFRCPHELLVQAKKLEAATGLTFEQIVERASNLYLKKLQQTGGKVALPFTPSAMKAEEKYLGSFSPEPTLEDFDDSRPLF